MSYTYDDWKKEQEQKKTYTYDDWKKEQIEAEKNKITEKTSKISNYNNAKKQTMKQIGTQIKELSEVRKQQEEIINNEIKNQVNNINTNFNKANSQNIQLPTAKNTSSNKINNNAASNYRNTALQEASKKILPTNIRLSTTEEKENFNKFKNGDMYKLSNGAIDDRSNIQKVKDGTINNIVAPIGNAGVGIVQSIGNLVNYEDQVFKFGSRMLGRAITKNEQAGDTLGNLLYEKKGRELITGVDSDTYDRDMQALKSWSNETIQRNIENTDNPLSKKIAELAPSVGQNILPMAVTAVNPFAGTTLFMTSAAGGYYDDAIDRGMNENQAFGYATVMGIAEGGSEALISGGMVSKVKTALTGSGLSEAFLNSLGTEIIENFAQEAIIEPLSEGTATLIGGKETANWDNILQRSINAGIDGILSAVLLKGVSLGIGSANNVMEKINNNQQVTEQDIKKMITDLKKSDKTGYEQTVQGTVDAIMEQIQNNTTNLEQGQANNTTNLQTQQTTQQENKTAQNQTSGQLNDILNNKELPMQSYQYEKSDNVKINNLRQDANKYFNNSEKARNYVNMLEKIITDKNIEIRLDANLKTTDGRIANGSYSNGVITINPNSTRTGEFIAIHELTHAIGTKAMLKMINTYRQSNAEFDTAVKGLLQNYQGTEISEEALADISAQLFGNQEFINNIAQNNPNIFQKLYSEIKYLWHQFRGYKNQDQFIEDLYYKWTQAYKSNKKLNQTTNYYFEKVANFSQKEYNNIEEVKLSSSKTWKSLKDTIDSAVKNKEIYPGVNEIVLFDYGDDIFKRYTIYYKDISNWKIADEQVEGDFYEGNRFSKNADEGNGTTRGRQEYNQWNNEQIGYRGKTTENDGISNKNERNTSANRGYNNEVNRNKEKYSINENTTKYSIQESENNSELSEEAKKQLHRYINMNTEELNKAFSDAIDNKENMLEEYNRLSKEYKEFQNTEEFMDALKNGDYDSEVWSKAGKYADKLRYYNAQYENYKAQQEAINSLLMGNETDTRSSEQIVKEAEKHFGITNNFKETAYIDINGNQIDFSGKHEGGMSGSRSLDHRQINEIDIDMQSFIDMGNIRIIPEGNGINLSIEPNEKQYTKLEKYIDSVNGEIYIDIDKTRTTYDSIEYKKGTSTSKIISDLQYYFKNGEFPKQSELAQFRYSIRKKIPTWQSYLEKNYKATGTRTNLQDIKLPTKNSNKSSINLPINQSKTMQEVGAPIVNQKINFEDDSLIKESNNIPDETVAKILTEIQGQERKKRSLMAFLKANLIDKGLVFEKLSRKANNRELQGKWDYILTAEARGQNAIGNERYDNNGNVVSKSLTDIIDEVGENTESFYNYMYHQLNIDRMTLEERFSGDTGINYERKSTIKNKPVFGKSVTAEISQKIVNQLEQQYPEFKNYSQDVYDFLDANTQELVDRGVISKETQQLFKDMYPHYVPISRIRSTGNAINVPLDTNRTGINNPIKRATGGNTDINPLFATMANRTLQTYRASARNSFGVELKNTLQSLNQLNQNIENTDIDSIIDSMSVEEQNDELLKKGEKGNNPTFTVFENGNRTTYEISEDMYDALKPKNELFKRIDESKVSKGLVKFNNFRRGLLTEYNPVFSLTNAIKDFQDILLNSQHASKTYSKILEATAQILKKGTWYQEYSQNGGETNSYFKDGEFDKPKQTIPSKIKNTVTLPLRAISSINNIVEMTPRLAEYIASRENGRSIETSMLDASRVTTNFKAGGDFVKTLNRNGFTFLNASVQGFQQQIRNIQEANAKGLKGYAVLATKYAIAGLPVLILNNMIWGDDDDYEDLQDYVKDNYYIIGKTKNGTFIRIPKGRAVATIQKIVSNANDFVKNDTINSDEVGKVFWEDVKEDISFARDNLAPNNPLENNVLAPIKQVLSNKTWYGDDLVPTRLQDKPKEEQYDETTDSISRWIGETLKVSPMKVNYLLDQYLGGVGDVILPMLTPQAENNVIEDKFMTDSTMKSKYPGEFFEKIDELKINNNSEKATDTDILKYKYMSGVQSEVSKLYKQKRDIQNSKATDTEKKKQLKEVQTKINSMTKDALENVNKVNVSKNTATVGDKQYYKSINLKDGTKEWQKISEEEIEKNKNISLKTYANYKEKVAKETIAQRKTGEIKQEGSLKDKDKIQILLDSNYSDKEKTGIYENYIKSENDSQYSAVKASGINITEYLKYKQQEFESDKKDDGTLTGKTVNKSKQKKVLEYLNSMKITGNQRLLLYAMQGYTTTSSQKAQLANYVYNLKLSKDEKLKLYDKFSGFTVYKNGTVKW